LTAISLGEDASLDISDEIAAQRYRSFHEVPLDPQTEPLANGSEISPHDPLLPLLLALPVRLGGWIGAKLALALANGVLGALLVWVAVRRFGVAPKVAAVVSGAFVASAPFAVYGTQIYPEIPAAVAVTAGIAAVTGGLRSRSLILLGVAIVALPWLSVKYAPVAAVLTLVALWKLGRARRFTSLGYFLGGLTVAAVAYVFAHLQWYGGLTVYATGDHFASGGEFSVIGTEVDLVGRSRRLIGLLVDGRFGLAVWQPAFLLALPAAGAMTRSRPPNGALPFLVAGIGWLSATFVALTMQGWWWPGRQTVLVLPALVLVVAWWAGQRRERFALATVVAGVGIASYVWLVVEGLRSRVTWIVDFYDTSNPFVRFAAEVTPDYLDVTGRTWVLHGAWIAGAVALFVLGRGARVGGRSASGAGTAARPATGAGLRAFDLADPGPVVVPTGGPRQGRESGHRSQRTPRS
jgi:hypothetical protein